MQTFAALTDRSLAGLVLGVLLVTGLSGSHAARAEVVVFEDHDLGDWQFLVPPGDPEIQIPHSTSGGSFLTVSHHHTAQLQSRKESIQGSALAIYAPGTSGAVDTFTFAGRFRAHYEGVGPDELYLVRALEVRAVVLQGGQSFVASRTLFAWANNNAGLD
ncbi:MAG: hypothetical protein ABIV06_12500, partial [Thermoanaerobaculia bacterium]